MFLGTSGGFPKMSGVIPRISQEDPVTLNLHPAFSYRHNEKSHHMNGYFNSHHLTSNRQDIISPLQLFKTNHIFFHHQS